MTPDKNEESELGFSEVTCDVTEEMREIMRNNSEAPEQLTKKVHD